MGLRFLSYNVRYATLDDGPNAWPERRDGVADLVRSTEPDVVCFQEVWETQFDDLADRLPGYAWVRERTSSGEHTPVGYCNERFDALGSLHDIVGRMPETVIFDARSGAAED